LDDRTQQDAANILSQVAELAKVTAEANRLKDDELTIQRREVDNRARELDLQAQTIALERERLNRSESRIQLFMTQQAETTAKLVTIDDSFGETVQRLNDSVRRLTAAQIDSEKAQYALLSQNSIDIRDARLGHPKRLKVLQAQELLLEHNNTLHNFKLRAAGYGLDVPVNVIRAIEKEEIEIAGLEERIRELEQ
jgi:hypothetical protein